MKRLLLFFLILMPIVLWTIALFVIARIVDFRSDLGQFGEAFGVMDALFSGLAVCGVVYTLFLQWQEIKQTVRNQQRLERSAQKATLMTCLSTELSALNTLLSSLYERINDLQEMKSQVERVGADFLAEEQRLTAKRDSVEQDVEQVLGQIAQLKAEVYQEAETEQRG